VNEVLILARLSIQPVVEPIAERYYAQILPALQEIEGFRGLGLWRGGQGANIAMYRYKDFESADEGLKAISGQRSLTSAQNVLSAPADVIRCATFCERGQGLLDAPSERRARRGDHRTRKLELGIGLSIKSPQEPPV
jgi:hypothetical protein